VQILKVLEAARPALEAEAVARKRAALRQGAPPTVDAVGRNSAQRGWVSEQIAQMAGVGETMVKEYHAVQVQGSPQLKEAVDGGEVAISDAASNGKSERADAYIAWPGPRSGNFPTSPQLLAI